MIESMSLRWSLFFNALFAESDSSQLNRFLRSLSFRGPSSAVTSWHRFWQPLKEAEGLAAKFVTLMFPTGDVEKMNRLRQQTLPSFALLSKALFVLNFFLFIGIGGSYLAVVVATSLAAWATFFALRCVLEEGWCWYGTWTEQSFHYQTGVPLDLHPIVYQRVQEIERKAAENDVTITCYVKEETVLDPIVTVGLLAGGRFKRITIGIYDDSSRDSLLYE